MLNTQAHSGEFSHPYIDKEIDNLEIKNKVDFLIEAELEKMGTEESEISTFPPPAIDYSEVQNLCQLNLEGASKYEDLCQQESLLEVLVKRQGEFWDDEIKRLEQYIQATNMQKAQLSSNIAQINLQRKILQEKEADRIKKLEARQADLEQTIKDMKDAINQLKASE